MWHECIERQETEAGSNISKKHFSKNEMFANGWFQLYFVKIPCDRVTNT